MRITKTTLKAMASAINLLEGRLDHPAELGHLYIEDSRGKQLRLCAVSGGENDLILSLGARPREIYHLLRGWAMGISERKRLERE